MAQNNNFKCSGDCMNCHPNQRAYCASQFTYNTMRMVETMQQAVVAMQGSIEEINVKIESLQDEKVEIFDPVNTAQSGDGADE